MKWLVFTLACMLMVERALAAPLELAPVSNGALNTRFVQLRDGKLLLLWTGADAVTWTQRLDAASGAPIGESARAGRLSARAEASVTEPRSEAEPRAVALPGGDVALVGLLADGRFTFARGSEEPARRVAARVLLPKPAQVLGVLGFAAVASEQGFVLAVLRAPPSADGKMDVELHVFGARGEALREPLRWQTARGYSPQLAVCGGVSYLAWRDTQTSVMVTTFSSGFERSPETSLREPRGQPVRLGLWCQGPDVRLLAGWIPGSPGGGVGRVAAQLRILPLTAAGIAAGASWRTLRLPGVPRANLVEQLLLLAADAGPQLLLARGRDTTSVGIELASGKLSPRADGARGESCMPLGAAGWLCAVAKAKGPKACRDLRMQLSLEWTGSEVPPPSAAGTADDFWAAPTGDSIRDLDAPSAAQASKQAERVTCGTKEWAPLRAALQRWCAGPGPEQAHERRSFCDADWYYSLLFQATRCSTAPLDCAGASRDEAPSVNREAYQRGDDVEFGFTRCWLHFARQGDEWGVTRSECSADEPMD